MTPELLAHVRIHRSLARSVGRQTPRRTVFAPQVFPRAIVQEYTRRLLELTGLARRATVTRLRPRIEAWVNEAAHVHERKDAAGDELLDELALIRLALSQGAFAPKSLKTTIEPMAFRISDAQREQLQRQLRVSIGIEVPVRDPNLAAKIDAFTAENVGYITSIPEESLAQVQKVVLRGLADGDRWEEISKSIDARFDVGESRAKLIASDQVGKFYSSLNRTRQTGLGITHFTWATDNDERVCPICEPLDGKRFTWENAPGGGPGMIHPLCRCTPSPDVGALLDSL